MEKIEYDYKKTPLTYQITEYDCGTTCVLNAIKYLFNREEIAPKMYKRILEETLDKSFNNEIGKGGTTNLSLRNLCNELYVRGNKNVDISSKELSQDNVSIYNKELEKEINDGSVAILEVYQDVPHYVLLTKLDENFAYIFDPYYLPIRDKFRNQGFHAVSNHPDIRTEVYKIIPYMNMRVYTIVLDKFSAL